MKEEFEDTKEVIKRRLDNTMTKRKRDNRTNNDLQNATQKIKDLARRIQLKTQGEFRCSGRVSSSCSPHVVPIVLLLNDTNILWY